MKTFKNLDIGFSIGLILSFAILTALRRDLIFIAGYFAVGAWQLVSMVVHAVNGWFTSKGSARYIYHRVVAVVFGLTGLGFAIFPLLWIIMYFMLFAAPVMAIIYTVICRNEYVLLKSRALIQLR